MYYVILSGLEGEGFRSATIEFLDTNNELSLEKKDIIIAIGIKEDISQQIQLEYYTPPVVANDIAKASKSKKVKNNMGSTKAEEEMAKKYPIAMIIPFESK